MCACVSSASYGCLFHLINLHRKKTAGRKREHVLCSCFIDVFIIVYHWPTGVSTINERGKSNFNRMTLKMPCDAAHNNIVLKRWIHLSVHIVLISLNIFWNIFFKLKGTYFTSIMNSFINIRFLSLNILQFELTLLCHKKVWYSRIHTVLMYPPSEVLH